MELCHEWFPCIDFERIRDTQTSLRKDGQRNIQRIGFTHVVNFLKYIQGMGEHEDVHIQWFLVSLSFDATRLDQRLLQTKGHISSHRYH
jgi:hypothetical protein